jgi:hypothetical protein
LFQPSRADTFLSMRVIGRRVGYFINDIPGMIIMINISFLGSFLGYVACLLSYFDWLDSSPHVDSLLQNRKAVKKDKTSSSGAAVSSAPHPEAKATTTLPSSSLFLHGEGDQSKLCGLHLYRCWNCRKVLLKPLQCARCRSVVYCSKVIN